MNTLHRKVKTISVSAAKLLGWITVGSISAAAMAQEFPSRPIRITTGEPGGGTDFASRLIAKGVAGALGQPVVVENRGGGALVVAPAFIKTPPDGHSLLLYGSTLWGATLLTKQPGYDPVSDLAPVTLVVNSPGVLVVHPSMPVKTVMDLIRLAKAKPGQLNYSATGIGSSNHLSAELFKSMAGVNIVLVNYKGTAPTLTALLSGEVQLTFANASGVNSHVRSKRLKALAVTSAKPTALAPGLPTIAQSGVPGYEAASYNALFAPARTPQAIIDRLNRDIVRFLNQPEIKEAFLHNGVDVVASSPQQLATTMKTEMTRLRKIIADAGIGEK